MKSVLIARKVIVVVVIAVVVIEVINAVSADNLFGVGISFKTGLIYIP